MVTLESDKATMDVPATARHGGGRAGEGRRPGQRGHAVAAQVRANGEGAVTPPPSVIAQQEPTPRRPSRPPRPTGAGPPPPAPAGRCRTSPASMPAPACGALARELEVDLAKVKGTGEKGRITKEDVLGFLRGPPPRRHRRRPLPAGGMGIPEIPAQDFSKFGPVEVKPLARIKRLSRAAPPPRLAQRPARHPERRGRHHRARGLPQGARRRRQGEGLPRHAARLPDEGQRLGARQFPEFNSSLSPEKDALIYKKYYNIGIAVDTPDGLVVPVLNDVDRKGVDGAQPRRWARSPRRRATASWQPTDMQGGTFTISSPGRHRRHRLHADRQRARGGDPRRGALEDGARSGTARSSSRG